MNPREIENPIAEEDFRLQFFKELEDKTKDCKNTNTIFDTKKYVLLEDVKKIILRDKGRINELINTVEIKEKMCLGFSHGLKSKFKKEYYSGRKDALTDIKNEIKRLFGDV